MHETEADGFLSESGRRKYQNVALPGIQGTQHDAEDRNAVQFELINAIEYAGITLEADAASDKTAGYVQLREAIFESAAIDTAAIADSAVETAKINDLAVETAKINDLAVTDAKLDSDQINNRFQSGTVTIRAYSGTIDNGSDVSMSWWAHRIAAYPTDRWIIYIYVEDVSTLTINMDTVGSDATYTIKPVTGGFPFESISNSSVIEVPLQLNTDATRLPGFLEYTSVTDEMILYKWDQVAENYVSNAFAGITYIGNLAGAELNFSFVGRPV